MAMPTLDKTYQFLRSDGVTSTVNKRLTSTGTGISDQRTVLLQIVNDMLGFASNPWTCIGSGDGAGTFGMAGVNLWTAISKLVFATNAGTAHSWIVLQQAGIAAKCQIVIDLISPSASANTTGSYMVMYCSPAAGFGAANGGADGTNTARPTATDEFLMATTTNLNFMDGATGGVGTARDYITNVIQSTDGQVTRAWIRIPASRNAVYFCVEKPKNPVSGWTNPVIARWAVVASAAGSAFLVTNFAAATYLLARGPSGTSMPLYATCEGFIGYTNAELLLTANELSAEWELYPVGVASLTVGVRGRHGRLFDAYWLSVSHTDGDTFPADGSRAWVNIGDVIMPWNGSIPTLA